MDHNKCANIAVRKAIQTSVSSEVFQNEKSMFYLGCNHGIMPINALTCTVCKLFSIKLAMFKGTSHFSLIKLHTTAINNGLLNSA